MKSNSPTWAWPSPCLRFSVLGPWGDTPPRLNCELGGAHLYLSVDPNFPLAVLLLWPDADVVCVCVYSGVYNSLPKDF